MLPALWYDLQSRAADFLKVHMLSPDLPYVRCSQQSIDISFDFSADGVQTVEIDGFMTERNDQVISGHGGECVLFT
ncbi:hypothetical protein BKP54_21315 [Ensifer sp. 1H6]|nr:hypothetical protein BKP54_21315 [Ensifer sp. 1H6]